MFLVLWPFVGVFGNTWTAWIAHFFFVMLVRRYGFVCIDPSDQCEAPS